MAAAHVVCFSPRWGRLLQASSANKRTSSSAADEGPIESNRWQAGNLLRSYRSARARAERMPAALVHSISDGRFGRRIR